MDIISIGGISGEAVSEPMIPIPLNTKKTTETFSKSRHRNVTDKYWSILFAVILTCWIVSWHHVTTHQNDFNFYSGKSKTVNKSLIIQVRDYNDAHKNGTDIDKTLQLHPHKIADKINLEDDKSEKKKTSSLSEFFYIIIELFTCNMSQLSAFSKSSFLPYGSDFILRGTIGFFYFLGSLVLMRCNKLLQEQPLIFGTTFLSVALLEHLSIMCHLKESIVTSSLLFHEKLIYWTIPETMFLVILLSNIFSIVDYNNTCVKKITQNVSSDDFTVDNVSSDDDSNRKIFPYHYYIYTSIIGFPFIVAIKFLMDSTISILLKTGFDSVHSYIIVGGSCYVGFTIYYFGLMVTSCTFAIASRNSSQSMCKSFQQALFIVARYHFGTACFHATLIFPRLRANFVMKESRLEPYIRNYNRLSATHLEIYKLSTTLTSVTGTSHSESIRNLLRLYFGGALTERSVQDFGSISKFLLFFLLSTNCFVIIALANLGTLDSRFSMATWVMYLKMVFIFNLAMNFFTSTSDAFELSVVQSDWGSLSDENVYVRLL